MESALRRLTRSLKPMTLKRGWLIITALAIAVVGMVLIVRVLVPPFHFAYGMHRTVLKKERQLLYRINHKVFAAELRDFAKMHRWSFFHADGGFDYFAKTDPDVPLELQALNPSAIRVFDDRIEFECGGALLSFGIVVFREGLRGNGTKELGEGIWFYAEDGVTPKP